MKRAKRAASFESQSQNDSQGGSKGSSSARAPFRAVRPNQQAMEQHARERQIVAKQQPLDAGMEACGENDEAACGRADRKQRASGDENAVIFIRASELGDRQLQADQRVKRIHPLPASSQSAPDTCPAPALGHLRNEDAPPSFSSAGRFSSLLRSGRLRSLSAKSGEQAHQRQALSQLLPHSSCLDAAARNQAPSQPVVKLQISGLRGLPLTLSQITHPDSQQKLQLEQHRLSVTREVDMESQQHQQQQPSPPLQQSSSSRTASGGDGEASCEKADCRAVSYDPPPTFKVTSSFSSCFCLPPSLAPLSPAGADCRGLSGSCSRSGSLTPGSWPPTRPRESSRSTPGSPRRSSVGRTGRTWSTAPPLRVRFPNSCYEMFCPSRHHCLPLVLFYSFYTAGGKSLVAEILLIRQLLRRLSGIRLKRVFGRVVNPPPIRAMLVLPYVSIVVEKTVGESLMPF